MPTVQVDIEQFSTKKQKKLLDMLNDKQVQKQSNEILKNYINYFVPKKSGALRRSAIATPNLIYWGRGLKYARYQYGGQVYGPNLPGAINGSPTWKSRAPKHPTGRELGKFYGELKLFPVWQEGKRVNGALSYLFGYSEPGTGHHWDRLFNKDRRFKAQANREITRYLKKECKDRGLQT